VSSAAQKIQQRWVSSTAQAIYTTTLGEQRSAGCLYDDAE